MESRRKNAEKELREAFGPGPGRVRRAVAPYRMSPLGAHTDHQEGLTCGFGLRSVLALDFRPGESSVVRMLSRDFEGPVRFDLHAVPEAGGDWGDHVRGVALELGRRHPLERGFDGIVRGELPPGGIASSAALEIAVLLALLEANDLPLDRDEAMSVVVSSERTYAGVSVGLLDPAVILHARENALVFLDCREAKPRTYALSRRMPPFEIILVDSGVRRDLRESAYNERVEECRRAAGMAGAVGDVPLLRDVSPEAFRRLRSKVEAVAARRADHYFGEIKRVKLGLQAVAAGDLDSFGHLMTASGESLTRLYDCGTRETRDLLALLRDAPGVHGASYAGGGFGGLVHAIACPGTAAKLEGTVIRKYRARHPECGQRARIHTTGIGGGAHVE